MQKTTTSIGYIDCSFNKVITFHKRIQHKLFKTIGKTFGKLYIRNFDWFILNYYVDRAKFIDVWKNIKGIKDPYQLFSTKYLFCLLFDDCRKCRKIRRLFDDKKCFNQFIGNNIITKNIINDSKEFSPNNIKRLINRLEKQNKQRRR